ncbi:GTP-binding protein Era [Conidiobolus coronatus NRRL 28638]|uniref:GTP-binding protein Era n=1 Tax=Conidiobolus coronatus (strain ATCC 28846 / CBS 209.66 / NRRL 28638) TaxID=796925 RepID=A0A137PEE8_CONC2|nr:GTP-binding protein Era [Conidiobolus coronatus NRRL 28638]|eukprot:KXN73345.1 GTP-binding protein Era [Conidiobolus coronatus NRRL 28638]
MEPVSFEAKLPKVYKNFNQPLNPQLLKTVLIGPPNAGKSTILNNLVQNEVSIVSARPQTTRTRIPGIMTHDEKQVIFLDTPGVVTNQSKQKFNRELSTTPWTSVDEADHLLVVLDSTKLINNTSHAEDFMFERLKQFEKPATLVLNKVDMIEDKQIIDNLIQENLVKYDHFKHHLAISAFNGIQLESLKDHILTLTYPHDWKYPGHIKQDASDYDIVQDTIRKEIFDRLTGYLPYQVIQKNVGWHDEPNNGALIIDQELHLPSKSIAKILIGTNGKIINQITQEAMMSLRRKFKRKVKLYINVKVDKKKL